MSTSSSASPPVKSPISFRPSEPERAVLEHLALSGGTSVSEVLRRGLKLAAQGEGRLQESPCMPFYALEVDDSRVAMAVDAAADAACATLDELMRELGSQFPERDGIDSNFRGLVEAHLRAMLCGHEHARKPYSTPLKPLFAHYHSFGITPCAGPLQGYTMVRLPERVSQEPLYFRDEGQWVSLRQVSAGELYTSREAAITGVLRALRQHQVSAREHPMQLALIDFSGDSLTHVV